MADLKGQITVVEQVYHQLVGDQPHLIESRFSQELESDEQPYERRLKVGEEGAPLDYGWIGEASQLVIVNEEGKNLQTIPTDEEREEISRKVLEVFYVYHPDGCWLVAPGQSMRACPACVRTLSVRSRSGTIRFTLHLLPK